MSKLTVSPYRRNIYNNNNKPTVSPYKQQPFKLAQKSKLSHSYIAEQNTDKKIVTGRQDTTRITQKKRMYDYAPPPPIVVGPSRLDILIQQNKFLLAENNDLANLLNDRSRVIISLQKRLEQQIAQEVQTLEQIQFEKNRFLEEYSQKMRQHSARNQCLMDQIAQLNQDIYQLQLKKNRQIQYIKQSYSRQHKIQLDNILSNHSETVSLMEIQNNKLKDIINNRDHQLQCLNHQLKSTTDRLKSKNQELERNLAHALHMKKIQLSEQKINYEKIIQDIKRQSQKVQQVSTAQYQQELKRVKKQLLVKQFEAEKLGNDISQNQIDSQMKINELYQKKGELENQISQLQAFQKTLIFQQTQRIKNLAQIQLDNSDTMNKQLIQNLKSQNAKLIQLNQTRGNQINRLYIQIQDLRYKNLQECDDLRLQIQNLKSLIQKQKQSYQLENQALKTKIAQLRHSDIHSLQQYYQNELATILQDSEHKDQIIQQSRDKIHHQIQQKTEMRKNFEIQISRLNIKIGELQLKVAGILHERKQDISSFGSQMQLTSMSLLRSTQQKQKYAAFSQSEKQRLQKMIEDKDRQIEQLNDKIKLMGENHALQIKNKDQQIQILKKTIEQLESNLKKQKFFLENQIKKKQSINKNDKQFYESQLIRVKRQTSEEYNRMISQLKNQKTMIESQRLRLKKIQKQLTGQLRQVKQFRQQQNLDREVAISQSMNRTVSQKQILEGKLKSFYKKQIDVRDNQIKDLRQQISQLNSDIRSHIQKEQKLEQKLHKLLQSQQKLRDMEQRVLALGQENNLVKNLSEIVKRRK